jgi:hypothetical protein
MRHNSDGEAFITLELKKIKNIPLKGKKKILKIISEINDSLSACIRAKAENYKYSTKENGAIGKINDKKSAFYCLKIF